MDAAPFVKVLIFFLSNLNLIQTSLFKEREYGCLVLGLSLLQFSGQGLDSDIQMAEEKLAVIPRL